MTKIFSKPSVVAIALIIATAIVAVAVVASPASAHPNRTCHWHDAVQHCR